MSAAQTIPHEDRGTYLGSHDTAAIFGLHPWLDPINIYMNKLGMSVHRHEDEIPEYMKWGVILQRPILDEFGRRMECSLENEERFIRHPDMPWFGGTPDATIVGEKAGVDAKNIGWNRGEWGEEMTDDVPEYIAMQCHHFMTLMDYRVWYVAALFGGRELKIYKVTRDHEISDMIIKADSEFWTEHIKKEIPPDIDGSESWRKYIERKFPKDNGLVRAATEEEAVALAVYKTAKIFRESWEAKEEEAKTRLCAFLGESAGITCEHGSVSYTTAKGRTTLDGKRLKEDMPDVYKLYEKTGEPYRMLRITLKENE